MINAPPAFQLILILILILGIILISVGSYRIYKSVKHYLKLKLIPTIPYAIFFVIVSIFSNPVAVMFSVITLILVIINGYIELTSITPLHFFKA